VAEDTAKYDEIVYLVRDAKDADWRLMRPVPSASFRSSSFLTRNAAKIRWWLARLCRCPAVPSRFGSGGKMASTCKSPKKRSSFRPKIRSGNQLREYRLIAPCAAHHLVMHLDTARLLQGIHPRGHDLILRADARVIVLSNPMDRETMSAPPLVASFYERLWNAGDEAAMPELLSAGFSFRGSLGVEVKGHCAFWEYVCGVRTALVQYRCEILDCVSEGSQAFAKMQFSGIHVGPFRGYQPSGRPVHWGGAALFRFEAARIRELWVLGDLAGLDALLKSNAQSPPVILG
jgi:predicted ester cyclase